MIQALPVTCAFVHLVHTLLVTSALVHMTSALVHKTSALVHMTQALPVTSALVYR